MIALFAMCLSHAFDGKIIRFGGAAGKDDFSRRRCADQSRHLVAGGIYRGFSFPTESMVFARRVTEPLQKIGQHGIQHARVDRRSGIVVEINRRSDFHIWISYYRLIRSDIKLTNIQRRVNQLIDSYKFN